jgi:excisionase family DNA binding protein
MEQITMVLLAPTEQFNRRKTDQQPMPDLNEFMTTKEAAEKLGFHVRTIPSMMKDKELDGIRMGRFWLVSKKSVEAYVKKTKGMSKNDPRRKQRK